MEALCIVAPHFLQCFQNFLRLNEFRNRQNTELLAEASQVAHQRAVNLGFDDVLVHTAGTHEFNVYEKHI